MKVQAGVIDKTKDRFTVRVGYRVRVWHIVLELGPGLWLNPNL